MDAAFLQSEVASGAPVPGRVPRSIMGKLTTVANRIVDRGELCVCPVKERRCQNTLSS